MTYKIILASQSPRRRELLKQIGLEFQVMPCNAKEVITKKNPCEVVQELAYQKAMAIAGEILGKRENEPVLVIGADTIVSINGEILGKPADDKDAYRMLSMLQGNVYDLSWGSTCNTCHPFQLRHNPIADGHAMRCLPNRALYRGR